MNNVLIGITGGIAAYKSAALCRLFVKNGYSVKVIMTDNACAFITPLTFEALTGNRAYTGEFDPGLEPGNIEHIDLAEWADIFVIAPATANSIAKIAHGIADNLLTSTVLVYKKPIYICPAMNTNMLENPATQANIKTVENIGHNIIEPAVGELACGISGRGRVPEPEEIYDAVVKPVNQDLKGLNIIVTAGPTREDIDPVRYITNRSSGKMGFAAALEAKKRGADVTLVAGPVNIDTSKVNTVKVYSAVDMLNVLKEKINDADILIMAAAVADYAPEEYADQKIKKTGDDMIIRLKKNPDILSELKIIKKDSQVFVGFAAESQNLCENAQDKLARKGLDFIVANDISRNDIGFDTENNEALILYADGTSEDTGFIEKGSMGAVILDRASEIFRKKNGSL